MKIVRLNNGVDMPILGLGVWKMEAGEETERAVSAALSAGYRLIDTAKLYGNERSVAKAIRESGIPRSEIFLTTKLWPTDYIDPRSGFERSLSALEMDYVDLYLIHWPIPLMPRAVWESLEKIYREKRARAIGISNYEQKDIKKLLSYATVVPAVNQVKFSPFDYDSDILAFCSEKKIALEAYSPLTRGDKLSDPIVRSIADKHRKSAAQIMIRWCIEHKVVVIPKSSDPSRIKENIDVFDFALDATDMAALDALS